MGGSLGQVIVPATWLPCCAIPVDCCLYPWPDGSGNSGGPFYSSDDLPETINVHVDYPDAPSEDVVFTKDGDYHYSGDGQFGTYTIDGNQDLFWVSQEMVGTTKCLVNGEWASDVGNAISSSDTFLNTYTVNGTDTITRTAAGSCIWTGGTWDMDYGITTPYKWSLNGVAKTDPQSDPTGSYGANTVA